MTDVDIFQGQDYVRKQFPVQAVQVTPNNIDQVAAAVKGEVKHDGDKEGNFSRTYIDVPVRKPLHKRQTQGYIGDWIVKQGRTFKVYQDKSFHQQFETKNGVVTQKPRPNKPKVKPRPSPANFPKKRVSVKIEGAEKVQAAADKIADLTLEGASAEEINKAVQESIGVMDEIKVETSPVENLVEGTKTSAQELPLAEEKAQVTFHNTDIPREDLGDLGVPPELDRLNEKNIEAAQEDADQAEIDANVEAQLAQAPVEAQSMGAFVNGEPADHTVEDEVATPKNIITLDQLNTQAGDTRTAQEIMLERNKA